ncbi:hypothetical protein EVAR_13861_1 [Eumeta japonica]|uniref:Uncharacterized protein n=1 Tax=Eumeta variegata TaxID=151549 RepID=A0A4C1U1C5_EUMVA|nr:hypothetical protein EVAR_13861_1 [Eumeta japonica]
MASAVGGRGRLLAHCGGGGRDRQLGLRMCSVVAEAASGGSGAGAGSPPGASTEAANIVETGAAALVATVANTATTTVGRIVELSANLAGAACLVSRGDGGLGGGVSTDHRQDPYLEVYIILVHSTNLSEVSEAGGASTARAGYSRCNCHCAAAVACGPVTTYTKHPCKGSSARGRWCFCCYPDTTGNALRC